MRRKHRGKTDEEISLVSVIIPVYNDPDGIRMTLDSLLSQSYPTEKYEILVVDNGSTDKTRDVIQEFANIYEHVHLLVEDEKQGSYAARNCGIRYATGSIIAFLDADVTVDHHWLEDGVEYFSNGIDYLACDVELYSVGKETLAGKFNKQRGFPVERYFKESHFGPTCGLLVRSSVFNDVGLFDERLISGGDGEFGSRVHQAAKRQYFADDIVVYHPTRSSLWLLINKRIRVGRGFYQRNQYYQERYGRPSWSLTDILPMRPWVLKKLCADWDQLQLHEKITFYFIEYILKIAQTIGRVKQATKTVWSSNRR